MEDNDTIIRKSVLVYKGSKRCCDIFGYNNVTAARNSLIGNDDYKRLYKEWAVAYERRKGIPEEKKALGFWTFNTDCGKHGKWILIYDKWFKEIWEPFVDKHYTFTEVEQEITVKNYCR